MTLLYVPMRVIGRDVNKARGVRASNPRPRPETCKAKATDP